MNSGSFGLPPMGERKSVTPPLSKKEIPPNAKKIAAIAKNIERVNKQHASSTKALYQNRMSSEDVKAQVEKQGAQIAKLEQQIQSLETKDKTELYAQLVKAQKEQENLLNKLDVPNFTDALNTRNEVMTTCVTIMKSNKPVEEKAQEIAMLVKSKEITIDDQELDDESRALINEAASFIAKSLEKCIEEIDASEAHEIYNTLIQELEQVKNAQITKLEAPKSGQQYFDSLTTPRLLPKETIFRSKQFLSRISHFNVSNIATSVSMSAAKLLQVEADIEKTRANIAKNSEDEMPEDSLQGYEYTISRLEEELTKYKNELKERRTSSTKAEAIGFVSRWEAKAKELHAQVKGLRRLPDELEHIRIESPLETEVPTAVEKQKTPITLTETAAETRDRKFTLSADLSKKITAFEHAIEEAKKQEHTPHREERVLAFVKAQNAFDDIVSTKTELEREGAPFHGFEQLEQKLDALDPKQFLVLTEDKQRLLETLLLGRRSSRGSRSSSDTPVAVATPTELPASIKEKPERLAVILQAKVAQVMYLTGQDQIKAYQDLYQLHHNFKNDPNYIKAKEAVTSSETLEQLEELFSKPEQALAALALIEAQSRQVEINALLEKNDLISATQKLAKFRSWAPENPLIKKTLHQTEKVVQQALIPTKEKQELEQNPEKVKTLLTKELLMLLYFPKQRDIEQNESRENFQNLLRTLITPFGSLKSKIYEGSFKDLFIQYLESSTSPIASQIDEFKEKLQQAKDSEDEDQLAKFNDFTIQKLVSEIQAPYANDPWIWEYIIDTGKKEVQGMTTFKSEFNAKKIKEFLATHATLNTELSTIKTKIETLFEQPVTDENAKQLDNLLKQFNQKRAEIIQQSKNSYTTKLLQKEGFGLTTNTALQIMQYVQDSDWGKERLHSLRNEVNTELDAIPQQNDPQNAYNELQTLKNNFFRKS